MRVRELMSRGITTIRSDASCQEAVEQMYRNKVRHLPVVDDGRPVGMVTDRDLRHHVLARGLFDQDRHRVDDLLRAIPVRVIMSSPVFSVAPDDPIEVAVRRMLQDKIGSLPVLEDGHPVGIITETDLLRQICRMHPCSPDVEYVVFSSV